jgi:HNH endonuclease
MRTQEERFLEKFQVDEATGCWLWTACRSTSGYGVFVVQNRNVPAHRWAYEHWIGPVPEGMVMDHFVCDTPLCVNPHHVRPASNRENTLRGVGVTAANLAKTHCEHGHEFTLENTYEREDRGGRECRRCRHEAVLRYRARKAA